MTITLGPLALHPQVWWFVTRATGIVAWAVLSASVLLGLFLSTRVLGTRPTPGWLQDLHRGTAGLGIGFTAAHMAALVADSYVHFDVVDLLVPMASSWRPVAVALGVVAMWLLVVVEATSLARRRFGHRRWRRVHMLSFVLWVAATAHFVLAGTDVAAPWMFPVVVATVLTVVAATLVRVLRPRGTRGARGPRRARPARPARSPRTTASA